MTTRSRRPKDRANTPKIDPDAAPRDVFVLTEDYDAYDGPWHAHRRAQLVHASEGVLTVQTHDGRWVVPPQRAVWILPNVEHRVLARKSFRLRTLYAEPRAVTLPSTCCVVAVDALVEALLVAAAELGRDYPRGGAEDRLIGVILDRLPLLQVAPLDLPMPHDERLVRLCEALIATPSDGRTLDALAEASAITTRTATRLFAKETGLTFAQWRQQLRLLAALERLGAGDSVTTAALDVGYADVSSFIAVFKAAFGQTPAQYFAPAPHAG